MINEDHVYIDGERRGSALESPWRQPGAFAWIALKKPDGAELAHVGRATGLDVGAFTRVLADPNRPLMRAADSLMLAYRLASYDMERSTLNLDDVALAIGRVACLDS